jgi:hypothetical protein
VSDYSFPNAEQAEEIRFRDMAAGLRFCMPGTIQSFDAGSQTVSVQPGIKFKMMGDDGSVTYIALPIINNCPLVLPVSVGSDAVITIPIKAGDPCLIFYSDRPIDSFMQSGSPSNPESVENNQTTIPRFHSLTDAMVMPGLITAANTIPSYNNSAIEIRNKSRSMYFSFNPASGLDCNMGSMPLNMVTSGPISLVGSNFSVDGRPGASGRASISSPIDVKGDVTSTGPIKAGGAVTDGSNRTISTHRHGGVESGGSLTGTAV